jgi:hypothetical protein
MIKTRRNPNGGTEPLSLHDFAQAVALNQCIFDGLCDLVLDNRPFPFRLEMPQSLGWSKNFLWLFPTNNWHLPPHLRHEGRRKRMGVNASWAYNYEDGRIATIDEILPYYSGESIPVKRGKAKTALKDAEAKIGAANTNARYKWRLVLGMLALRAFNFLFHCNTGGNGQVVRDLETDGTINLSVQNQKFRSLKWRAAGKEITLIAPATFMPRLRRFMELRRFLLQDKKTPYLFFTLGQRNSKSPKRTRKYELENLYRQVLVKIDPQLPKMGVRKLRASVDDYYLRFHDSAVAAAVMGHTVKTEEEKYARGSASDHHEDMSAFLIAVSDSAHRQRVISISDTKPDAPALEQGGRCYGFGRPEPLSDKVPVQPNCRDSDGCIFCFHRTLIAGEEDARKVASAAYVMEQLILGPKHAEALQPLISKCDEDLEKMAAFPGCRATVDMVRKDVYEKENLTEFWADKYQLFLELGVL